MKALSIHPRNWPGAKGKKVNTSRPMKDQTKGIFGKRFKRLQGRQQMHDIECGGKPALQAARRRPGSMR